MQAREKLFLIFLCELFLFCGKYIKNSIYTKYIYYISAKNVFTCKNWAIILWLSYGSLMGIIW